MTSGFPPILTFPRQGGRGITPLPVPLRAYPGAYTRLAGGGNVGHHQLGGRGKIAL